MPQAKRRRQVQTSAAPITIGFRLDDESRCLLAARSARLGLSVHELARFYVIEALKEPEEKYALRMIADTIHRELTAFREDHALATEVVLRTLGKQSEQEIIKWVEDNLNRPCCPSRPQ